MLVRSFPGKPEQVSRARKEVRAFLNGMPGTDDVLLVVSELASNAVQHSLSRAGDFVVAVRVNQVGVYVEVTDEGGEWLPPDPDDQSEHLRGLGIVEALSSDWGVTDAERGCRVVWAKVPVKAAGLPVPPPQPEAGSPTAPLPGAPLSSSAFSPPVYLETR